MKIKKFETCVIIICVDIDEYVECLEFRIVVVFVQYTNTHTK